VGRCRYTDERGQGDGMRKTRKRILIIGGSILGVVVAAIAALIIVFVLTMPDSPSLDALTSDVQRPLPESWFDPVNAAPPPISRSPVEPLTLPYPVFVFPSVSTAKLPPAQPDQVAWTELSGLLRMASDAKPFG